MEECPRREGAYLTMNEPKDQKEHATPLQQSLVDAFNQTQYRLSGHGPRKVEVLKRAFEGISDDMDSDMYGKGEAIEQFQREMAEYLGKESAVFFPSGTMAQQIALRIWCDRADNKRVAYHPLCHLEIHEEDGLKELHGIKPILLADSGRLIKLEDVESLAEPVACLLLELPQREIGGQLPAYAELEDISAYCRSKGIKLHLDGARLFEILPYYNKTAAEVCALFDSVYVSFYKTIGGLAGAILAGESQFTEESKVWKRRHGGDLISLYPYILSSKYYFAERIGKMGQYYRGAVGLAARFEDCPNVSVRPPVPVSNMFHIHFAAPKEKMEPMLCSVYEKSGVGLTGHLREAEGGKSCYFEFSVGDQAARVPAERIDEMFRRLADLSSSI